MRDEIHTDDSETRSREGSSAAEADAGEDGLLRTRAIAFQPLAVAPDAASILLESYLRRPDRSGGDGSGSAPPDAAPSGSGPAAPGRSSNPRDVSLSRSGAFSESLPPTRIPSPGDRVFGFRLRRELGRGSFARVFLAEQTALAGRPVVLKVSGIEGKEPQALAQLQHTHIVPIFSLHEDARAGLRALCMPYFGGASLSAVLHAAIARDARPTAGRDLLEALDRVADAGPEAPPRSRAEREGAPEETPRTELARLDYVGACAWLVARLAEGLEHAHRRGILHRDIKPSNVLLAEDGQPMLLDFNLAQEGGGDRPHAGLGGTVAYMAPEHLRAMSDRDPVAARSVDRRADIYSLGMVLYELMTGRSPYDASASRAPLPLVIEGLAIERERAAPSARRARPDVPWSLESVVLRCLAPRPADRYQRAEELAEDLRRYLSHRPLRHAPELSLRERARKWVRRHPRLSSSGAVAAVAAAALVAVGLALMGLSDRLTAKSEGLAAAQAQDRKRAYQDGALRARFLVNTTADHRDHLREGLKVCRDTLALYGVLDDPDWYARPDLQCLSADDRRLMAEEAREVLVLLAGAQVRLADGDAESLAAALALLDRAEAVPGLEPCRALWEDRAAYLGQRGEAAAATAARAAAAAIRPTTARDHYLLAMTCARAGRYDEAVGHLDRAVRIDPRHYWSWLQRGLCHRARGEPTVALGDFGTCVGLWPEFAWGYFNRGCVLAECGKAEEAVGEYSEALRRDPDLVPAYVNRGMLLLELERNAEALADLRAAGERKRDDAALHSGLGVALERLGRTAEADAAFAAAEARSKDAPADGRRRLRWVHGFAVARRKPAEARAAFAAIVREEPTCPQALFGLGMLLERKGADAEALEHYARAMEGAPGFVQARRARAVVLARLGRVREAGPEINLCLEREPRSEATLYAAACVASLAAGHSTGGAAARATDQAVALLERAIARGHDPAAAADDRDLDGIRADPRTKRLLKPRPPPGAEGR